MKNTKLRVILMFLAITVMTPVLLFDAFMFATATVVNRNCTRPMNIFYRISDVIGDYILKPWFSLLGLWEDSDPCS